MTAGTIVHLDEHVGRIIRELFPLDDEAYLLCLTSQELSMIRQMCFPYLHYRTRFVDQLGEGAFRTADDVSWLAYHQLVEDLEDTLGGCAMPCSDILTGLQAVAAALAAMNTCNTTVNCGGGGVGGIGGVLAPLPNDEILPQLPVTEPPIGEGAPPEGFDTWEQYLDHKCKAAWFLHAAIRNLLQTLGALSGAAAIMATVSPAIVGWSIGVGVVFAPAGFALLCVYVLAFLVMTIGAYYSVTEALEYWDTNRSAIICAMYNSGSADDALDVLADFYEDAVEAITWEGILAPLGTVLAGALAQIGATALSTNLVNILFTLAADVIVPDAVCECGAEAWSFDYSAEGWTFPNDPPEFVTETHGWTDAASGADPGDGSPGRLYANVTMEQFNPPSYYASWVKTIYPALPCHTGDTLAMHAYAVGSNTHIKCDITYTDDTSDGSNWQAWSAGWTSLNAIVTAPNDGKSIKSISFTGEVRQVGGGVFYVDHVVLTVA